MSWVAWAMLTALMVSIHNALLKGLLSHRSAWQMLLYPLAFSAPFCLIVLGLIDRPPLGDRFWWAFFWSFPANGLGFLLYMQAIRLSPLSLCVPFLAFTPAFLVPVGYLVSGEEVSMQGLAGIGVIVAGGYLLSAGEGEKGVFGILRLFQREKGTLLMLLVSFIFSFGAILGKVAVVHSSPLYFGSLLFACLGPLLLVIFLSFGKVSLKIMAQDWKPGLLIGLFFFAEIWFHNQAVALTLAAYMVAIKRMNLVFSVIIGWLFLKETGIKHRLPAAMIMLTGAMVVSMA